MKRNNVFKLVYTILCLLPLLMVGVCALILIFNKNSLSAEGGINIATELRASIEQVLIQFGCSNFAGNGASLNDSSMYLSSGYGLPILPIFLNLFNSRELIVAYSQYLIFVNWYLSYLLLVTLLAFIPFILNIFVNFAYRLIDFSNKELK